VVVAKDLHGGNVGAPGGRKEGENGMDCLSDKTTIHARGYYHRLPQMLPVSFINGVGVSSEKIIDLLENLHL